MTGKSVVTMPDGNGNGSSRAVIGFIVGSGIMGVIAAGMLAVANDARIAINVAEQHGEEILILRGEIVSLRDELRERTRSRYTERDHEQFAKYMEQRLQQIEERCE